MNSGRSGIYLLATVVAMTIVLPLAGYIWSLPPSSGMVTASVTFGVLSLSLLFLVYYFSVASGREIARLTDELQKKSAQILELVEAEREDDRIVESLTERIGQLKSTLLHVQSKQISGQSGVTLPDTLPSEISENQSALNTTPAPEHPRVYSAQEFRLLASQVSRIASRYERQFTIIRIRMNVDERIAKVGREQADTEYQAAVKAIIRTLRISDFAALEGDDSIIIGYPETSPVHVDAILSRLRAVLKLSDASELEIELDRKETGPKGKER